MTGPYAAEPTWQPESSRRWARSGDPGLPPAPEQNPISPAPGSAWVLAAQPPTRWPGLPTIIERTLVFITLAPRLFASIALFGGAGSVISTVGTLILQSALSAPGEPPAAGTVVAAGLFIVVGLLWSLVAGVLFTFAAAEVASGTRPTLDSLGDRVLRPTFRTLLAGFAIGGAYVLGGSALVVVVIVPAALKIAVLVVLAIILATPIAIGLAIAYALRWSLVGPAIVLESRGPLDALRRSRQATAGMTWRLVGFYLAAFFVVGMPTAAMQALGSLLPPPGPIAAPIVAAVLVAPFIVVTQTVLFGALIGRPWTIAKRMPRAPKVAVGLGVASLFALVAFGATAATQSPLFDYMTDPSHGQVEFGRMPASAAAGCHVGERSAAFDAREPIYVSVVLALPIANGTPITSELTRNGVVVDSRQIIATGFTSCYIATSPLTALDAGTYRLTISEQRLILADGTFVVGGGGASGSNAS